ncbi:MAG TPA: NACHT domain-containing protein [Thermoanaerobaculia bacterium]|nr:NACHT domain-containing protein [Thermoanaerobaculia bacterium]
MLDAYAQHRLKPPRQPDVEAMIAAHISELSRWTGRIEFFGLSTAKGTDQDTIDLFLSIPRKFRGMRSAPLQSELSLLESDRNYILLGDPGAGKTTTLKRLARFVLTHAPRLAEDDSDYPIVVRLRELHDTDVLDQKLGRLLGVEQELIALPKPPDGKESTEQSIQRRFVGSERLATAIAALLDSTHALLLLDGLDEVSPELRTFTERQISRIAEKCQHAKIIVTCRSGDFNAQLSNFDLVELAPLEPSQISDIAHRWTRTPDDFLEKLSKQSFLDLANRPLFLCQLLVLYEERGLIPDQPADVIELIVRLAIEEWDIKHKKLPRLSRYAAFDTSRKRDFLAHLAFWLTYELHEHQFTSASIAAAYLELHERFRLPYGESDAVVRELETHTGIFVDAGRNRFEFSHLSLQEYLCATYVVRESISSRFARYLLDKPAPIAVACALAPRPEHWLPRVLLNRDVLPVFGRINLEALFARILQERPPFIVHADLGFLALTIMTRTPSADGYTRRFLTEPVIEQSTARMLEYYQMTRSKKGRRLALAHGASPPSELVVPRTATIPEAEVNRLLRHVAARYVEPDRRPYNP